MGNRLAEGHYMFGRSPSSVDAVMYGYLAPLLKAPFPSNTLQNYLNSCTNLVKFVVRISQNYFPRVVKSYEEKSREEQSKPRNKPSGDTQQADDQEEEEEGWPHQTRNKIIAGAVASTAMMGY